MIKLTTLLYEDGWDDYDIDPKTGALIPKKGVVTLTQVPDEEKGGPLGRYVFGNTRKDLGEKIEAEPDTELERKIYNALVFFTSFNTKDLLNAVAKDMKEISDSGLYSKYFSVPSSTAWRILVGLSHSDAENILGRSLTEEEGVIDGGMVSPRKDSVVTSWTTSIPALRKLYSQARFEGPSGGAEGYCIIAKCETSNNPFFFNIDTALPYLDIGNESYPYQKEILAYGDVSTTAMAYKLVKDTEQNPVPLLLKLLK